MSEFNKSLFLLAHKNNELTEDESKEEAEGKNIEEIKKEKEKIKI